MKSNRSVIFFLVLVIFLLFLGCGSRKSSINEKKDIHTETVDSSFISVVNRDSFIFERLETHKTGIYITVTEFSFPDSLGKQYPTKVTAININQEGEIQENAISGSLIRKEGVKVNKDKKEDKSRIRRKEKKNNKLIPIWIWWLLIGGIIGGLVKWFRK